jgi:hypothetical protein
LLLANDVQITLATVAALVLMHALLRGTTLERVAARTPWPVRAAILTLLVLAICLMPGPDRAFIYFQF